MKWFIGANIESLFRRWSFTECITYIGTVYNKVLNGRDSVEEPCAGMVDAVSIRPVLNYNLSCT